MAKGPKKRARTGSRPASSRLAAAIGRAIQVVRTDRGWSRKELATKTGLSYSYLSEIENGVKDPSSRTFAGIADALDVAPGALLYDAERRLIEVGSEQADQTISTQSRGAGTPATEVEITRSRGRARSRGGARSVDEPDYTAVPDAASERPPARGSRTLSAAPSREAGPRIERSRRVLDWLAGPLARRSSEDTSMTTELELVEPGGGTESLKQIIGTLLPLLGKLSPEDRALVLDLARRLAQRDGE